jgi:tRNA-modifying protein YgfZ
MNQQWRTFLKSQSATINDADEVSFENGDQLTECNIFDLSHLRLTSISGEDAEGFLQGQFTNDIRAVSQEHHQMSGYCTPKGRMLANFRICSNTGQYILQTPTDTQPALIKRLSMFVLRSNVTIEDVSNNRIAIGIAGECCQELLKSHFRTVPFEPGQATEENGVSLLRLPGPSPRYMLVGQPSQITAIWEDCLPRASATNHELWTLLDIRSGIPTVYADTAESFVPQMVNMQMVDGVSFDKGCYVGQEIVARMKYLGTLKRRMYLARVDAKKQPLPGDEIYSPLDAESGQGHGNVVMSARSGQGCYETLAVLNSSSHENGNLHLESETGPALEFSAMPYQITD